MVKKIVCRCHDVTESDIRAAIESGYDDLETLKRITGVTTGHCQGKTCLFLTMQILEEMTGKNVEQTTRIRPPIDPLTLGSLVAQKNE
ncbi:(2Fe-2S)-binding protein [Candidatus Bathyarchaeota archaeon]|nr:MAG: (2Fe-2S)-binding protein [Candidatus Bathyarchaeota archaeon]